MLFSIKSVSTVGVLAAAVLSPSSSSVEAFVVRPSQSSDTRLFLEDRIAKLIDDELYREQHHAEYEAEWMNKNREAIFHSMHATYMPRSEEPENYRIHAKDRAMAIKHPDRYCMDRCISTGNCDIYEDL
jgi:hypothetical protein